MGCTKSSPPPNQLKQLLNKALAAVSAQENKERDKASTMEGKLLKAIDAPNYQRSDYQERLYAKDATYHTNLVVIYRIIRSDLDKIKENMDELHDNRLRNRLSPRLANIYWCLDIVRLQDLDNFAKKMQSFISIDSKYKPDDKILLHYKTYDQPDDQLMQKYIEDLKTRNPEKKQTLQKQNCLYFWKNSTIKPKS